MKTGLIPGFQYLVEVLDAEGCVQSASIENNIIPLEGMRRVAGLLTGAIGYTPTDEWFIGLIGAAITVDEDITSTIVTASGTENTAYTETTRQPWVFTYDNAYTIETTDTASRAEFNFVNAATIRGAFLTTASAKTPTTSQTLLSVVNFSTARPIDAGGTLRITAGIVLATTA